MNSSTETESNKQTSEFQKNLDILRQVTFFSGLDLEPLKVFAYLATRERLKPGESLFKQGEQEGQFVYVISGRLAAFHDDGGALVEFGPDNYFGFMALIGKSPHLFTVTAEEESIFLTISRERFFKTLEQFPGIGTRFLVAVSEAVGNWERKALEKGAAGEQHVGVSLL
ncbi:cyclic nucleotide-binding domain-containing protein [Oceanidesulfovibrio marinus]|nr:cyclic nucleotide-binding domain-containing protein [Oceanidesulfovibrio marinus]